jgi:opacity protein-like surface antigen
MKHALLALLAAAAVVAASAAAFAQPPNAPSARGRDRAPEQAARGSGNGTAPDGAASSAAHGNATSHRGEGLLTALQHVPERVRAHLQALWDALQQHLHAPGHRAKPA